MTDTRDDVLAWGRALRAVQNEEPCACGCGIEHHDTLSEQAACLECEDCDQYRPVAGDAPRAELVPLYRLIRNLQSRVAALEAGAKEQCKRTSYLYGAHTP